MNKEKPQDECEVPVDGNGGHWWTKVINQGLGVCAFIALIYFAQQYYEEARADRQALMSAIARRDGLIEAQNELLDEIKNDFRKMLEK